MKRFLVFGILSVFLANLAFATGQTDTDCLAMRESDSREDATRKQNLNSTVKPVSKSKSGSSKQ